MLTRRAFSSGLLNNFATKTPAWVAKAGRGDSRVLKNEERPDQHQRSYRKSVCDAIPKISLATRPRALLSPGGSSQARSEVDLT